MKKTATLNSVAARRAVLLKRTMAVGLDAAAGLAALLGWVLLFHPAPFAEATRLGSLFVAAALATGLGLQVAGVYRSVVSHMGLGIVIHLAGGMFGAGVVLVAIGRAVGQPLELPAFLFFGFFGTILVGGWRLAAHALSLAGTYDNGRERVLIYGAGQAGLQLAAALERSREFQAVAFVDDAPAVQGRIVRSLPVHAPSELDALIRRIGVDRVLLALPSASRRRRQTIVETLESLPVKISTVPGFTDIITGVSRLDQLKPVAIEDLLGRDPVTPHVDLLSGSVAGKAVLVTGAGGSIGSELCRQIIELRPRRLVLYEWSEFNLYQIDQTLRNIGPMDAEVFPILGSTLDELRLREVFETYGIETIYHAAAYKHVPLVEFNTLEAVRNNVLSTVNVSRTAIAFGAERFILISTDKAVRPTNVMGASKRLGEMVVQALAAEHVNGPRMGMVRFGNVLGSSGSVVPLFQAQIARGGPVTVTDPEVVRYFMTIPEAVQLVIQSGTMAGHGDVFVLDMGDPVRIYDLARRMIQLSGHEVQDASNPNGDIEIVFTGLRPGEKLYEELLIGEKVKPTTHPRIMRAQEEFVSWHLLQPEIGHLDRAIEAGDRHELRELLTRIVIGYRPSGDIVDLLWRGEKNIRTAQAV